MSFIFSPRQQPSRILQQRYEEAIGQGNALTNWLQNRLVQRGGGAAAPVATPALPGTTDALSTAGDLNRFNQAQVLSQYRQAIPNYNALTRQSSQNIAGLLNPTDFREVDELGAELGVASGISGSQADASRRYQMRQSDRERRMALGEQMFTGAVGRRPQAPLTDPSQFLITPFQQAQLKQQEFATLLNYLSGRNASRRSYGNGGGNQNLYAGPRPPAAATPGGTPFTNPFPPSGQNPWEVDPTKPSSFYAPPPTSFQDEYSYLFPDLYPPIIPSPQGSFTGDINFPIGDDALYG